MTDRHVPYSNKKGVERYIKDASNRDVYIKSNNYEIYAFDFTKKREIIGKDEHNKDFYAKRNGNEIYPIFLDSGFQKLATVNGKQMYVKDQFQCEKYPLNLYRKEKIAKDAKNTYYYAKDANGDQFYPIDDVRNEWIHNDKGVYVVALTHDAQPQAPRLRNGSIKYEKENGKQVLYLYQNTPFFGKNASGDEVYPLDDQNNSYYPMDPAGGLLFAKNAAGQYQYATSHLQKIVYPKDASGQEQYLEYFVGNAQGCALEAQADAFERYIASKAYPTKEDAQGRRTEIVINNTLSETYPLDSNQNEYTNDSGELIESLGYPITNDNFIILPNVNNKPKTLPNDKHLLQHVKKLLYRPYFNTYDFLTDVPSKRKSNVVGSYPYKVLTLSDYKMEQAKTDYYIIGGLVLIIFFLLICIL